MQTLPTPTNPNATTAKAESTTIPLVDRFVLWMFLIGVVLFGLLLLSDMFCGLVR